MQESTLQDKLNAIGSNTIMGDMSHMSHYIPSVAPADNADNKEITEESSPIVSHAEAKTETANAAIDKLTAEAMQRMVYMRQKPLSKDHRVGRNEPCPCGSGKKYKNCCLASGKYETYTRG